MDNRQNGNMIDVLCVSSCVILKRWVLLNQQMPNIFTAQACVELLDKFSECLIKDMRNE